MENKLEQLLNSLIKKGWKPFGKKPVNINQWNNTQTYCKYFDKSCIHIHREDDIEDEEIRRPRKTDEFSLRELVSKESWLWQFVCENWMVKKTPTRWEYFNSDTGKIYGFYDDNSTYRLIESSLKDESELEDFLLSNIKIEWEV